ncbi:non-ribosomal peptide synthetase, partial [Nonomuraea antimicrobica]|uniref:non-ribosomal peptide synthetase n=1 Tax=Nonomuraea antimicrobica TaxID=561173 RepID=UPI0031F0CB46
DAVGYAALGARVQALAARLRERGVGPESVVAIRADRSIATVVALLAVLEAGGAYLPLDADLPGERVRLLLADGGADLVLSGEEITSARDAGAPPAREPGPADGPGPGDAAYVIYTSGSTGRPKGVVVEHEALAGRVAWMREHYGLGPGDRVVQFASTAFDAHAEEIFPALASGAALELLPGGPLTLPELLASPRGREITVLDLPTAYWHQLVAQIEQVAWPERLRLVIIGGEKVHAPAVARWRARFGDAVRLVNTYGPTEATIIATVADLGEDHPGRPPIGLPIGGTRAHVVGPDGDLVPPGVPGELLLSGAGLARGYLGRPGLTAERFVTGPGGERAYRTGDQVRLRPDGLLEFLGRLDDQVKVRGFRIEPGEIEERLLAHPRVRQAAVVARDDRLVAYVAGDIEVVELRRDLTGALPPYLVPDLWVARDALPLTPGGKVDRAALPDPGPDQGRRYVAPGTDAETLVADVWREVLGTGAPVGALDDFFALGGHSLLAVRVTARLRASAGVDVPIRAVFAHRTVAELAAEVERLLADELSGLTDEEVDRLLKETP